MTLVGLGGTHVTVDVPDSVRHLDLPQCSVSVVRFARPVILDSLSIGGLNVDVPIEVEAAHGIECPSVTISSARCVVANSIGGLRRLELRNGFYCGEHRLNIDELEIAGTAHLHTLGFRTHHTIVRNRTARIAAWWGPAYLGQVSGGPAVTLELSQHSSGSFFASGLPTGSSIALRDADISFVRGTSSRPIADVTIGGSGRVHTSIRIENATFEPDAAGDLEAILLRGGEIHDASGPLALRGVDGGFVSGSRSRAPLRLTRIDALNGMDLEQVSLYSLNAPGSVTALGTASRVVPWVPRPLEARSLQIRQARGSGSTPTAQAWASNAEFWSSVASTLDGSNAPATVQASVRVAHQRARRRSTPWGTHTGERLVLSLHAAVGYGERVLLPLLAWLAATLVAATALDVWDLSLGHEPIWRITLRLLATPLTPLRLGSSYAMPNAPGLWDNALSSTVQVLGLILVGFSLVALRRLGRPTSPSR